MPVHGKLGFICQDDNAGRLLEFHCAAPLLLGPPKRALPRCPKGEKNGGEHKDGVGLPAPAPAASAANEFDNQEEYQRADRGVDDRRDNTHAKVDAESGQQPPANEGSYDSDDEVTDDPKPGALHDLARQPSCNEADHQYDKKTFTRHDTLSQISNEFGNAGRLRSLQIFHQIALLHRG
jgi:hypothetical protein